MSDTRLRAVKTTWGSRHRWASGALLLLVLSTCGCPDNKPATPKAESQPFRGRDVELVVPAALQLPALWDVAIQEWTLKSGATVRWSEYADAESLEKSLAGTSSSGGRLVLFPLEQLSKLEHNLAPIDPAKTSGLDLKDLFKGLRERVVSRNRQPVAVPVAAPVLLCYYRADLLRSAGLKAPETWEEYQSLVESLDKWAGGLAAVEPLAPGHASALLSARSLAYAKHPENYSVWFDLENGKPVIDSVGFREAVEMAQRAWKKMPAAIAEYSPIDCRNQVLAGKAALAIGAEPVDIAKSKEQDRAASIEIGICRLPGSRRVYNTNSNRWDATPQSAVHAPALCGFSGTALGVGTAGEGTDNTAAWNLLTTLAGDQFESNWSSLPKSPCRESQIASAVTWNDSGLNVEESSKAVDATAQMLRDSQLVADLPLPQANDFRSAMDRVARKLVKGEIEADAAVKLWQSEFESLVKKSGEAEFQAQYRRGLGLSKK